MRAITKAGLTAVSLTAGVALAGCSSSSAATATASATATATVTVAPGSGGEVAGTCQPGNVTVSLGHVIGSATAQTSASGGNPSLGQDQFDQVVELTNSGSTPCTMSGYPGVNLEGTASDSKSPNYQWALTRGAARYARVTLPPGQSAHFGIVYLPMGNGAAGRSLKVSTVIVTPPNAFSSKTLPWSKTLLLQDAATHPGTWITPVQPGSGA